MYFNGLRIESIESWDNVLKHELQVCARVADAYPRNYYAWNHRKWVLQHINTQDVRYKIFPPPHFFKKHSILSTIHLQNR